MLQILIFSNSTRQLNVLEELVINLGFHYKRLDGKVAQHKRPGLCKAFNEQASARIFLVSTLAGGLGLNLTGANKCAPRSSLRDASDCLHCAHRRRLLSSPAQQVCSGRVLPVTHSLKCR